MEYIPYEKIVDNLDIKKGDTIFISSDIKGLAWESMEHGEKFDADIFIDSILNKIGDDGTLIFPTYNWDFCSGHCFDYYKTPCKTGVLGKKALKRKDFKRTKHPIYSCAVWGKDQEILCSIDFKSSFGSDSIFAYMHKKKTKNILIDIDYKNCFTFAHYVEENVGGVPYRYSKDFTGDYIDESGNVSKKTYSMLVRNLDMNVIVTINPLGEKFKKEHAAKEDVINNVTFLTVYLDKVYPIIEEDIINNKSRNLCTYIGQ